MARSLRRTVGYANWLFNPFHRLGAEEIYGLLDTDTPTSRGLYLNLGYWPGADSLDDACEAMIRLVGDTARLTASDRVLDCGFGFAEQDIFWARSARPRGIVGLNITPSQVLHAREHVGQRVREPGDRDALIRQAAVAAHGPARNQRAARGARRRGHRLDAGRGQLRIELQAHVAAHGYLPEYAVGCRREFPDFEVARPHLVSPEIGRASCRERV